MPTCFPRAVILSIMTVFAFAAPSRAAADGELSNAAYHVRLEADRRVIVTRMADGASRAFASRFTVLIADADPKLEMRWGEFGDSHMNLYNVSTWMTKRAKPADNVEAKVDPHAHVEDGFDPKTDKGADAGRTANYFRAAPSVTVEASDASASDGRIEWRFADHADFQLSATIDLPKGSEEPRLSMRFVPREGGKWYSVGYTGAPEADAKQLDDAFQPLVWQERRFPNLPFLTESYRATIPGTLVTQAGVTTGVIADASMLPFDPLPTYANSGFGVMVRDEKGSARSMLFAPMLGGAGSKMDAGKPLDFQMRLLVMKGDTLAAYEHVARALYGFRDYRRNDLCSLNQTFENTVDYAMSEYAHFNDELRGSAYDTDVPGAVKNVSALHPLGVALVTDNAEVYHKRARPMIEYAVSREKFLFTTNPKVTGQSASSKLLGPGVPLSEMTALYEMSGKRSGVLLALAEQLYTKKRVLNLDAELRGDTWQNALALHKATGNQEWLDKAVAGADEYIKQRVETPQTNYTDPHSRGMFFWTSYAPQWIELYELYEITKDARHLAAAREGARRYTQFIWMCPRIPEGEILVNRGGVAPSYRSSEKFKKIQIPEERAPAWRLSEIGLTPESSGTSKGHRAVFLASYGPYMLRVGSAAQDAFLHAIGRSAVIGRSTSFPGYHINTARTTVYEKPEFARRPLNELNSTTSLHYNHIWPHVAMQLDFLVSDAVTRSKGAVNFPSHYAEGYAYLQSKVYGDRPGTFYGDKDVWLWMPKGLVRADNVEINYVAARGNGKLYLVLTNQSDQGVTTQLTLNETLLPGIKDSPRDVNIWRQNEPADGSKLEAGAITVPVAAKGITALAIENVEAKPAFQQQLASDAKGWAKDHVSFELGKGFGMVLNMGQSLTNAYVYLQANGDVFRNVKLHYKAGSQTKVIDDSSYPFEYTVPLAPDAQSFEFMVEAESPDGKMQRSEWIKLTR